jgi:pimeloyl-ACP methyl ester carboxylesterase
MPFADIDGINTHYQVIGSGSPLLLLEPIGSCTSVPRQWPNRVWRGFQPLTLARDFRVIAYDRRESGQSGGRVEPLAWELMARHAKGLLDFLEVDSAFLLGACVGCATALSFAAHFPERCRALFLHWPVGGYHWMKKGQENFERHIAYIRESGLSGVVARAKQSPLFWTDPNAGPWSSVIASDPAFAESFSHQDLEDYFQVLAQSREHLFCDAMPSGANCEQLLAIKHPAFIMAGNDAWHTTSTAHMLRELMPKAKLSALMPDQQNAATIATWIYECAAACGAARSSIAA